MMYDFNDVMDNIINGLNDAYSEVSDYFNGLKSDVIEFEDRYEILTDVPGAIKDDIKISFENKVLSIEVKKPEEKNEGKVIFKERNNASKKMINIKSDIDFEGTKANLSDGVLKIVLMKHMSKKTSIVVE